MGKKVQSKKTSPKVVKTQEIKKNVLLKSKNQVKKSPKKKSTNKKHSKASSKKKPLKSKKNTANKNNKLETKNIQPSKKKQTKKSVKKVNQKEQIKKSLGYKKLNIQKKKQQKNQRLLNLDLDQNQQKEQYKNQINIQKQHQPIFAIYRKQVPQRWRESIIRYHEAKESQFRLSNSAQDLGQSFLNNQSYHLGQSKQNVIHNSRFNSNQQKDQQKPGIKRSQRLKKSKTHLAGIQSHLLRSPQVIEIQSSYNSGKSQNNFVSFNFQQNLHSDSSKLEQSHKNSQNHQQSINSRNITPENYQIQRQNDSSISNHVIEQSSKSQSKVSYEYQIMSLSQSKQNSNSSKILNHHGKGKKHHNMQQKSSSQEENDEPQSQEISSHSISPQYTVEKIVSSKIKGGKTFYQIKWVGYPDEQNTLQPIKNLKNIMEMVVDFQKRQKQTFKQSLKQSQRILAQKNRQIASKSKQLVFKTKKLDDMKKKVQQLTKKLKDLQKQKKVLSKIEQRAINLKNQCNAKSQFLHKNEKIKLQSFSISQNFKVRIPLEQNQKDKISSNSTQTENPKVRNQSNKNKQIQKDQGVSDQLFLANNSNEKALKLQISQRTEQKIKEEFFSNNFVIKIPVKQNNHEEDILNEQIMLQQKFEIVMPQLTENIMRIDDFDPGQIHHDLQMVEYSFPFFNTQNLDKNQKNRKYLHVQNSIIQQDNLQNQQLMEEYDCLKYLNTDQ